eukprot:11388-Amphidinium_carterae.1
MSASTFSRPALGRKEASHPTEGDWTRDLCVLRQQHLRICQVDVLPDGFGFSLGVFADFLLTSSLPICMIGNIMAIICHNPCSSQHNNLRP